MKDQSRSYLQQKLSKLNQPTHMINLKLRKMLKLTVLINKQLKQSLSQIEGTQAGFANNHRVTCNCMQNLN